MVVTVSVVLAVPPADKTMLVLPKVPLAFKVLEADNVAVPAYPPIEVRVMVEVALFPGDGEEMVMLVAEIPILGLVTVIFVVPEEAALKVSPP
jgi:hypothetical protein